MRKLLHIALLASFALTVMVPLTGIHIHKLASAVFLLLSGVHTVLNRRKLGAKRWVLLGLVAVSFATGLSGMLLDQYPVILILHRAVSIGSACCLAVHIYVFRKKIS